MSWLYSAALVEEYWGANSSDGEQSVQSSGNLTQLAYLPPDKMTKFSRLSRFGMTFKPLTADLGEELLTLFREDFLAKTYPQQEKEQELPEANPVCGNTWHELLVKYDLNLSAWRTVHCLLNEELQWSLVTLPKWGMTHNGVLFQHPTAERPINEIGFGLWLTPSANEDAAGTPNGKMQKMLGNDPKIRGTTKTEWDAGTLNPTWVEWLMGWPIGWTDLKPLETARFQSWQQQHSGFYQVIADAMAAQWGK